MTEFLGALPTFLTAIWQTLLIVLVSLVVAGAIGLGIGIVLYGTREGGLFANRAVHTIVNVVVNIVRPVPFIIFIVAISPLTVAVMGTYIGIQGAIFAISIGASFAVSRIVEQNLLSVDPGVIEAARAMGASPARIVFTVLIPEGLGPLVLGYTFVFVGLVDMSAQAGAIGGGGLGDFAIRFGYQQFRTDITLLTVVLLLVIVQALQWAGDHWARRLAHV